METISYAAYFDKLYGCFLGKTISGTIGAPYEGVKMPMELPFKPEMADTMLPNDDLDLQILWLDVLREKGASFTSLDLLDRFVNYCTYSPGEYAVMRKNYGKAIYPPYSGIFCNDYYREGMGCPIRSEIWACVAPLNPSLAADFAYRDGQLDHDSVHGESVIAEMYFAALESMAFGNADAATLINAALDYIPNDSKFAGLVRKILTWCDRYKDMKPVLRKILFDYGHPDCTNMYQNMGITLAAILLGDNDIIKTSMLALNCGFDTDCTCASAGSVIGLLLGAKKILAAFNTDDIHYKLSVDSERRSDSVRELCEDIAAIGIKLAGGINDAADIAEIPETLDLDFEFAPSDPLTAEIIYENCDPSIIPAQTKRIYITLRNNTEEPMRLNAALEQPEYFSAACPDSVYIEANSSSSLEIAITMNADIETIWESNIFTLTLVSDDYSKKIKFGLSGAASWKLTGPLWRTEPVTDTESLLSVPNYYHLLGKSTYDGNGIDIMRHFHVNMQPDPDIDADRLTDEILFAPVHDNGSFEERAVYIRQDSFTLNQLTPFAGACTVYLTRRLISPADTTICMQIGQSQPYKLWLNGEAISECNHTGVFTSENYHLEKLQLKKGINYMKWRITKTNADTKMSLIFSEGPTCAAHYTCFGSERVK